MTKGDYFPAYAFSENFKYLYLMFADRRVSTAATTT